MSNTIQDVKSLPGAKFYPFVALFPAIADNEFNAESNTIAALNAQAASAFDYACRQWTSDASIARAAGNTLPPKPIAPNVKVVLRQDIPNNGGTWIAQTEGDPLGVCPDLPAPVAPAPQTVSGLVASSTPYQPTQDQKLDAIATALGNANAKLDAITAALKKQGVM